MMTIFLPIVFVFPSVLSFLILSRFRLNHNVLDFIILKCSLAIGAGIGFSSLFFFIFLLFFRDLRLSLFLCDATIAFAICALFYSNLKFSDCSGLSTIRISDNSKSLMDLGIMLAFWLSVFNGISQFFLISVEAFHGGFDAMAIWNLRARFIFRSGDLWHQTFSPVLASSNSSYPLLLPLSIVRCWLYFDESGTSSIFFAFSFTFLIFVLLSYCIKFLYGKQHGHLAGIFLLNCPFFIGHGASQYADIPLAFYMLSALAIYAIYELRIKDFRLLILSGFLAGLAAWTKNEGILFVGALAVGRLIHLWDWHRWSKEIVFLAAGVSPALITVLFFKFGYAASIDLYAHHHDGFLIDRIIDQSRYIQILRSFVDELEMVFNFSFIAASAYILISRLGFRRQNIAFNYTGLYTILIMLLSYFGFYVISPYDLNWHLDTSLARLLLQLLPSTFFILFSMIGEPDHENI